MKMEKIKINKSLRKKIELHRKKKRIKIGKLKELQEQQNKKIEEWAKQGDVDTKPFLKEWKRIKNKVFKYMLKNFIHNLAFMDGAIKAGDALSISFGLEKIEVDIMSVQSIANKVMKLQTMKYFLKTGNLSKNDRKRIWKLYLRKEYEYEQGSKRLVDKNPPRIPISKPTKNKRNNEIDEGDDE